MTLTDIIPQERLAALLGAGHALTYAEDTVIGNGWFADLRDGLGRVIESGGGRTQAAARAHLAERLERSEIPVPTAAPVPGPAIMHDHLTALLDAGYEVALTSGGSVDSDEYYAHVRLGGGPLLTGDGKSPAEAIWTASPLHGDDEPMPVMVDLLAETSEGLKDALEDVREVVDVNRKVTDLKDDVRAIDSDVSDLLGRVDGLEGKQGDMSALIYMLGDLFKRVYPDGYTAKNDPAAQVIEQAERIAAMEKRLDDLAPLPASCGDFQRAEPYGLCTTCGRTRYAHELAAKAASAT